MAWRLLGPVTAETAAGPVKLAARPRAVLLTLLTRAGELVSVGHLVDALWGDGPPKTAHNSIARFVADLRYALGPRGDRIVTEADGYRVEVRDGELDLRVAEAARVRAALVADDGDAAHEVLTRGLACFGGWPNDALVELRNSAGLVRHCDELLTALSELDVDIRLRRGDHRELVNELWALTAAHPLHERFWAQLMVALYRSGRQAEALDAYQRLHEELREIGLEPSPPIRRVEAEILAHRGPWEDPDQVGPLGPAITPQIPLSRSFSLTPRFRMAGRRAEVERFAAAWEDCVAGSRRTLMVVGEPGIGKTRLATEQGRAIHDGGGNVLLGRCQEGLSVPYQPFVEALRHVVLHAPEASLPELLGPGARTLGRLVPELVQRLGQEVAPSPGDPEIERYLLFEAVMGWLDAMARMAPTMLVLDDLHWANEPTLLLLRHIVRSEGDQGLLIVGTYRYVDLDAGGPLASLLGDLRGLEGVGRISLRGLDENGVADLVAEISGSRLGRETRALAAELQSATSGNPLYAVEMLASLVERGALAPGTDGVWRSKLSIEEAGVPLGVREVVTQRVRSLPEACSTVLRAAAVIGEEFEADLIAAVLAADPEDVVDALDVAERAGMVDELDGFTLRHRFTHAVVRKALVDELSAARRRHLHGAVARSIELLRADLDDHRAALAHHWFRAGTAPRQALEATIAAARSALEQSADRQALEWLRRATALLDEAQAPEATRIDVLTMTGEVQRRLGDPAHRAVLLDAGCRAGQVGDAARMAAAALANGRGWQSDTGGIDGERVAALEAALAAVGHTDPNTRALLLMRLAVELVYEADPARRLELADEALAEARTAGDAPTVAAVLTSRPVVTLGHDTIEQRQAESAELIPLADRLGDPSLRYYARTFSYFWRVQSLDVAGARRAVREADGIARTVGQPMFRWIVCCFDAALARLAGDLAGSWELVERSLAIGTEAGIGDAAVFDAMMRSVLLVDRAAPEDLTEAVAVTGRLPAHYPGPRLWPTALQSAVAGHPAVLRGLLDEIATSEYAPWGPGGGPRDTALAQAAAFAAAAATLGEPSPWVRAAADYMDPWRGQLYGNIAWHGPTESVLAAAAPLAGRPGELDHLVGASLRICEEIGSPLLGVYGRVLGACGLRARDGHGDRGRADQLVEEAVVLGDRLGARLPRVAAEHFPVLQN